MSLRSPLVYKFLVTLSFATAFFQHALLPAQAAPFNTSIDDQSPLIQYFPPETWSHDPLIGWEDDFYNGSRSYTWDFDSYLTFTFTGIGVSVWGPRAYDQAFRTVTFDGVPQGRWDHNAPERSPATSWWSSGIVPYGEHTVEVRHDDTRPVRILAVDRFIVLDDLDLHTGDDPSATGGSGGSDDPSGTGLPGSDPNNPNDPNDPNNDGNNDGDDPDGNDDDGDGNTTGTNSDGLPIDKMLLYIILPIIIVLIICSLLICLYFRKFRKIPNTPPESGGQVSELNAPPKAQEGGSAGEKNGSVASTSGAAVVAAAAALGTSSGSGVVAPAFTSSSNILPSPIAPFAQTGLPSPPTTPTTARQRPTLRSMFSPSPSVIHRFAGAITSLFNPGQNSNASDGAIAVMAPGEYSRANSTGGASTDYTTTTTTASSTAPLTQNRRSTRPRNRTRNSVASSRVRSTTGSAPLRIFGISLNYHPFATTPRPSGDHYDGDEEDGGRSSLGGGGRERGSRDDVKYGFEDKDTLSGSNRGHSHEGESEVVERIPSNTSRPATDGVEGGIETTERTPPKQPTP